MHENVHGGATDEGTRIFLALELPDAPFRINIANGTCNVNPEPQEAPNGQ